MPPRVPKKPRTEGASHFEPDDFCQRWTDGVIGVPSDSRGEQFHKCIIKAFGLRPNDTYVYRATAEVTLAQVSSYLNYGSEGGLLAWYKDEQGNTLPGPPEADIAAYTNIFEATTSTSKALTALRANARRDSLRANIATHLAALYQQPPTTTVIPKRKSALINPYHDLWTWSCHTLQWAGPDAITSQIRISHAILPVFYHHFGCLVPTYEALTIILSLARGRTVVDLGSGNGYWTYMLRRSIAESPKSTTTVVPLDNGWSEWRTVWVGDTVVADAVEWLSQRRGGIDDVLLLVYPQVTNDFTGRVLHTYQGDTIIVAGTQNSNGYTGFADETIDRWMERELPQFAKICQVPLPSFAGKDEALFAFVRREQQG